MYFSKKFFSIILITCMLISIVCTIVFAKMIQPEESIATTWKFQSIDTMKYSRDHAKDETIKDEIPLFVKQIADMKATHIAIATPYDEEFYPFLSTWVSEARKYHLKIWFRGNVSGWEGWFGYKKISDPQEHHALIRDFILKHQDIFESGDIFTPAPEAENGGFGDPRGSLEKSQKFNQFLIDSYTNCKESFIVIHKNVQCGYFSMNGDVAREVLTKDTVEKTGNVVVIDHYVNSPQKMGEDIDALYKKFHVKIVLGEFGAPIPDINGDMTEQQQATFIDTLLWEISIRKHIVDGVNYWVLGDGSTALLNNSDSPRLATETIKKYYAPNVWKAKITDLSGTLIFNAHIQVNNQDGTSTFTPDGTYYVSTPLSQVNIRITHDDYVPYTETISFEKRKENNQIIILKPINETWWYKIEMFFKNLLKKHL